MFATGVLFFISLAIFMVVLYFIGMLWFSDERNRKHMGLFALAISMSFWMLFNMIGMVSEESYYPLFYTLRSVAVAVNPYCALVFARDITKSRFLNKPVVVALNYILPFASSVMIVTDHLHHLFFIEYRYPTAVFTNIYWINYGLQIAVWILAFSFLLHHFYKTLINKRIFALLVVAAVSPIFVNFLFEIPQVAFTHDFVPYVYFVTFAVFALFTNPSDSFNLQTKALPSIVDSSPELYFIIDPRGVVMDGNLKKHDAFESLDFTPGKTKLDELVDFLMPDGADNQDLRDGLGDHERTFDGIDLTVSAPDRDGGARHYTFALTKKIMLDKKKYKGFIVIMSDVSEYRGMIDEINSQNENLLRLKETAERASETKSTFLANMSHEMRTPLNAIIGLSELELGEDNIDGAARDNLEKIYGAGMTLLSTINDVLDISKIESGKFELIPVEYDTPSLINDTITLNIMRINEKPIEFRLHVTEDLPAAMFGDELRVKQVFNNILSNAFKYTREGTVDWTVSSESDGDDVWLISEVRDSGIGIKKEDMDKLFSDYNQVDTKSNRAIEGTGLGLAITKQVVGMMGGEVHVESEYMKGSSFTVRLRQGYVNDKVIGKNVADSLTKFTYTDKKRDKSQKMLRAYMPYAKVLVVDDVPTNLDVAKGMMKPYGMTVDCVTSGQAAIGRIRNGAVRYDAIFMDHMMPEMDGIEATKIIREKIDTEYARTIPIIALTANAVVGTEQVFLANGFQAFLSKPIDIMKMDEVIIIWVRDKDKEAELGAEAGGPDAPPNGDAPSAFDGASIAGLDIEKGLARFGGTESYIQTLRSYAEHTPPLIEKIRSFGASDLPDVAVTVHGIKGSSYGICADGVGKEAEALEHAAKAGDFAFVSGGMDGFIGDLDAFLSGLTQFLDSTDASDGKPIVPEPDKGLLARLAEACENYRMDEMDEIITELDRFRYENDGDLIPWIRARIEEGEFGEVAAKLSGR
ncbi:MAG: response regulator [Clostridiales Family XIII bacterium]|jgi:signal transduction histidine kinase/CheY-like chemotaxis protein|nr:response regulator [Clostridiales Family XIII bacterium]